MNLDLILLDEASGDQELGDVLALIALQLDHLPQLLVLHHVAVAAELLLQILENLLVAELLLQPLHRCQAFLPIPLLDAYVHILLGSGSAGVFGLGEWIECGWNLNV